MRRLTVQVITIYQIIFATIIKHLLGIPMFCRYRPTCSFYTQQMIQQHGILKGGSMGFKRLLTCHPFAHYGSV